MDLALSAAASEDAKSEALLVLDKDMRSKTDSTCSNLKTWIRFHDAWWNEGVRGSGPSYS